MVTVFTSVLALVVASWALVLQNQANNREAKRDAEGTAALVAIWHGLLPGVAPGTTGPDGLVLQNRSPSPVNSVWVVDNDVDVSKSRHLNIDQLPPCLVLGLPLEAVAFDPSTDASWSIYFRDENGILWQRTKSGELLRADPSLLSLLNKSPTVALQSETAWRAVGGVLRDAADCARRS